ncbi:MAG: DHH family phosphoesterase, partial [Patescibacteria group bacterium]
MNKSKNIAQTTKKIIVIYHDDLDGFTGAWSAWKKLKDKADYLPIHHDNKPLDTLAINAEEKDIYIIDYSFKPEEMKKLVAVNKKVVLIDHHITSAESTKIVTESLCDTSRSGAYLAWKYFHTDKKIPKLVSYVEDYDLWKFKLPFAQELTLAMSTKKFNFKTWDKLAKEFEDATKRKELVKQGKTMLDYRENLIHELLERGEEVVFEGHRAFAINSPMLESEIGHHVYEKKGMLAIIWSYRKKHGKPKLKVSLRSDKSIDVAE